MLMVVIGWVGFVQVYSTSLRALIAAAASLFDTEFLWEMEVCSGGSPIFLRFQ